MLYGRQRQMCLRDRIWTIRGAALLMAGVFWVGLEIVPVWVGFAGVISGIVLMLWPQHKLKKGDDAT